MAQIMLLAACIALFCTTATAFHSNMLKTSWKLLRSSALTAERRHVRTPFIAGNWKCNPSSMSEATKLIEDIDKAATKIQGISAVNVAIFPPHPFIDSVQRSLAPTSRIKLGAQNVADQKGGAFTGEVSAAMIKSVGIGDQVPVKYALIGHSERRSLYRETDQVIGRKIKLALEAGLSPVVCFGETQQQNEASSSHQVCGDQLRSALKDISEEEFQQLTFAYEPVWAIGTGLVCPPDKAQELHQYMRDRVLETLFGKQAAGAAVIQYGGSVTGANAEDLLSQPDIDGCLIGGASLKAEGFASIIRAAVEIARKVL